MGEVHAQKEPVTANSPQPTPTQTPPKHKCPSMANSQPMHDHADPTTVVEPTDLLSMMHLNNGCCHRQPPCSAVNNPMKRRSPPSCSFSGEPSTKKLFCDQEDLSHHGFSAVPIPLNLNSLVNKRRSFPVLRRCVSDPCRPPAPAPPTPAERGSGLPPLPPGLRRSVSDLSTPSPSLNAEETATPDSVKLRRMKERLKEMRQWWDEVMKDDEEENVREEEECIAAEDEKVLPQDDLGAGDSEEAVSVEWAEKCVSLGFRCPCGKGYEVLLSENNCYYKLV
ncbi:uncharacterized protein LOC128195550 [Vigna angularis]|uniref:uncharacterized protein LOC128195550 n=1 Tax=Phaseolus angularis TaxID=3914 RepID=UPI0022B47E72|nr:uncharacterized protein LOC128195550 [Vigna angularis]